jgi:cell division protein FtsB
MADEVEEPELPITSLVLAPLRIVKRFFSWIFRRFVSLFPALEYQLERRKQDKREVEQEIGELVTANRELERRIRKLEMEK